MVLDVCVLSYGCSWEFAKLRLKKQDSNVSFLLS